MKPNNRRILQVLSPYGNWRHARGMQTVTPESARQMRNTLNGTLSRLKGKKLPIYIGHPDDKPSGTPLPKPVGYIREILETDGGIAVESEYDEKTYAEILDGKFVGLSPRWEMRHLEGENFMPIRLISAGLTNNPNIPGSGKILAVKSSSDEKISECRKLAETGVRRCKQTLERAQTCLGLAKENLEKIKTDSLQLRLGKLCSNTEDGKSKEKISASALSAMALERSKSLGEPYSRSFAILRRQYDFK